jgi:hypothetical protein
MAHGAGSPARRAATVDAWASSAVWLVAGVAALRRGPHAAGAAKSAWFPMILNGARLALVIWLGFRAPGEKPLQPLAPRDVRCQTPQAPCIRSALNVLTVMNPKIARMGARVQNS